MSKMLAGVCLVVTLVQVPSLAHAAACDQLRAMKFGSALITVAEAVDAGAFLPPGVEKSDPAARVYRDLPPFCRVAGVISPAVDSHIEFEVWMPTSGWNGKYMGVGNGGSGGYINYGSNVRSLADALRDQFAAASTDTGHHGADDDFSFARGHREKRIDYHYRAIHETALAAKRVISIFYGAPPKYSYFIGGSDGGRQGLMEVQRYPADYDGVLVFAPTFSRTESVEAWTWVAQAVAEAGGDIPQRTLSAIQAAAVAACDSLDGVTDGVISEPTKCRFDPASLQCHDAASEGCLTERQVVALKKFYGGPRDSKGRQVAPGFMPGAETDPGGSLSCKACKGSGFHRASIFFEGMLDARVSVDTFNYDRDVQILESGEDAKLTNATEANLKSFKERGGKLIVAHGWSDGVDPPLITVNYIGTVVKTMGERAVDEFLRLYLLPGVYHNGRGPGPNDFRAPMLTALERWVERGVAPDQIIVTKYRVDGDASSGVTRTRPLCPYPRLAIYKGSGSIDEASSFLCTTR